MPEPALAIRDLRVDLGVGARAAPVLRGVGLDVAPGEIVALVGESGSGKTTIGLAAQGLLPAGAVARIEGSIRVGGQEVVGARPAALRRIRRGLVRMVPQDPMGALNPTMRVGRQLREAGGTRDAINAALGRMGLADPERIAASHPWRLSGGQRQRVMSAMALLAEPALVIADEPTTALDVTVQAQILDLLRGLAAEGTAILFVTHDLGVAATLAHRILVCYAGRIVEAGPVGPVIRAPAHPYTGALLAARFDLATDRARPLPAPAQGAAAETGCPYRPRCPRAAAPCAEVPPLAPTARHGGLAACVRADEPASEAAAAAPPWPATAASPEAAFTASGVVKSFPHGPPDLLGRRASLRVLDGIDLAVARGECVALVGESGSGKSTLLRIVAGLEAADAGRVALAPGPPPQVVFQDAAASLTPWLPVGSQIGEPLRGLGASERRERVREAMATVGLDPALAASLPGELSGGQCQRAAVARAVVRPPSVLLCDEPISAMDVSLASQTLNLLGELRRRLGMGLLFVTHDLAAARLIADRIAVLERGRLVEVGPAEAVMARPRAPYTRRLIDAVPRLRETAPA